MVKEKSESDILSLPFCTPKLDKDESESDHESQRKTSESDT